MGDTSLFVAFNCPLSINKPLNKMLLTLRSTKAARLNAEINNSNVLKIYNLASVAIILYDF